MCHGFSRFRRCSCISCDALLAQTQDPRPPAPPRVSETVVVSATRREEPQTEIPGEVTVISGDELRRENVNNLADALQDVVGLDTGMGSDNGARQPNVGLWGLKEFDALLFMVDGVPIGGPFNPSLSQIDIERHRPDRDRQGPAGDPLRRLGLRREWSRSSRSSRPKEAQATVAGGSFSEGRLGASTNLALGPAPDSPLREHRPGERLAGPHGLTRTTGEGYASTIRSPAAETSA